VYGDPAANEVLTMAKELMDFFLFDVFSATMTLLALCVHIAFFDSSNSLWDRKHI